VLDELSRGIEVKLVIVPPALGELHDAADFHK